MSDASTFARPYARAVFELGRDGGSLDAWSETLSRLAALAELDEVRALISRPGLDSEVLAGVVADAAKLEGAQARNLVRLLVSNGRLGILRALSDQYEALKRDFEQTVDVEITTAAPAGDDEKAALSKAVERQLARRVQVRWQVDESLIAGAVIRAGDTIIDGSAAAELEQLRHALHAA